MVYELQYRPRPDAFVSQKAEVEGGINKARAKARSMLYNKKYATVSVYFIDHTTHRKRESGEMGRIWVDHGEMVLVWYTGRKASTVNKDGTLGEVVWDKTKDRW